jgi:2-keto-4-pentenoate hydratase/2-oxohepta-3-ene-1,7-dioic acid hydratase in catechol pathway
MKLATFSQGGSSRIGIVQDNGVIDVNRHLPGSPLTLAELIARWADFRARYEAATTRAADWDLSTVKLEAPVQRPGKILAIGLNYADHVAESGLDTPTQQIWFSKAVTAINAPYGDIELPAVSEQLDYECELVIVIGKRCRNVPRSAAQDVIFGLCAGNDVSVRDWQLRTGQWVLGKSFDTHAPIGPWVTTTDEVQPGQLDIRCLVNGEVRQHSNTRHLVFDVYAQIEHLTQALTLEPGDLLFTGTCGGVGLGFRPPRWLQQGDLVRVEIEGLGVLENRVVAGSRRVRIE